MKHTLETQHRIKIERKELIALIAVYKHEDIPKDADISVLSGDEGEYLQFWWVERSDVK